MFSIVMENCLQENYLTEKLLGCFITLTIPIYWGCPNVTDYFDPRGMFIVNSVNDILDVCRKLTPNTYNEMLPYLLENKRRAEELINREREYVEEFDKRLS